MAPPTDILMPKLGLTMTEGVLAEWRARPGERVRKGDILFVVETDKIATEIEAPADGAIGEILVREGETVPVGAVLARWLADSSLAPLSPDARRRADAGEGRAAGEPNPRPAEIAAHPHPRPLPARGRGDDVAPARVIATPLARRLARQRGVDLAALSGTGPHGRIRARDVEAASTGRADMGTVETTAATAAAATGATDIPGRRIEPTRQQKLAARRLAEAKRDVPHFYLMREADAAPALALIARGKARVPGGRLTLTHLLVAAAAGGLAQHPELNRVWHGGAIFAFDTVDIGVAVQTDAGLLAPVLRRADRPLPQLVTALEDLFERARANRLGPDDMAGGVLTVSNLGAHGVSRMIPIINAPQAAILGVGRVGEVFRPDGDGRPVHKRELALTLAADHRILDGVAAARLLGAIVDAIEHPESLTT